MVLINRAMPLNRSDLADLAYFIEVAKQRSFRRAAVELGVSASALSHALSGLETRLGVRLLNRTTRSVTPTAAGEELLATLADPFDAIGRAVETLNRFRDAPAGHIRINVSDDAAELLLGPVMPVFADRYPDVEVDVSITNKLIDVIDSGFDAGIRYGGTVPEDMVAQRVSAAIRWVAAAAPDYLERCGTPAHPDQLRQHRCIRIRLGNDRIYDWEFEKAGEEICVASPGRITIDNSHFARDLALRGGGIIYAAEPTLEADIEAGRLNIILGEWGPMGPAFHVYYSSRKHVPVGLKLLVELIRELRPLGM